jgi:hypothetical protein
MKDHNEPMPKIVTNGEAMPPEPPPTSDLLLLPDGRILAHNLTRALAELLTQLSPGEETIQLRARPPATRGSLSRSPKT